MVGSYSDPYGPKRPVCQIQVDGRKLTFEVDAPLNPNHHHHHQQIQVWGGGGSSGMGLFEEAQTRRLAAWPFLA